MLIGAVCVAVAAIVAAVFAVYHERASADERVADAVRRLAEGMQASMRDLAEAYDEAQAPAAAAPRVPETRELASSLDLEVVVDRTLEAVGALAGVDTALLDADGPDGR